jgi:RNA recognition motif-containing protein
MNIYVGNLSFKASEVEVRQAFAAFGEVSSVAIIKDQATGKSRGFAFVEMPNNAEAQAAIAGLNGKDLMGRNLMINEARPRTPGGSGGPRRTGGFSRG